MPFLASYYRHEYISDFTSRFRLFFWLDSRGIAFGRIWRFPQLLPVVIALPVLISLKADAVRRFFHAAQNRQLAVFAALSLIAYLVLPDRLPGEWFLYFRFSVFVYIGIISCASLLCGRRWRTALGLLPLGYAVAFSILYFSFFTEFKQWSSGVSSILKGQNSGKSLSAIIADAYFRNVPSLIHYNNYHIIWNKGVAATCLTDYRFAIIRRAGPADEQPEYSEWIEEDTDYEELLSRYDKLDLLLVHGAKPFAVLTREPRWTLIERSRDWALFGRVTPTGR